MSKKLEAHRALKTLEEILGKAFHDKTTVAQLKKFVGELSSSSSGKEREKDSSLLPIPTVKGEFQYFAFSDGACRGNPGPGAWGALIQDRKGLLLYEKSGSTKKTTNNQMELQGSIEALKFLLKKKGARCSVILFSDSKYVVDGISSWVPSWKKRGWKKADKKPIQNRELWQELDGLVSSFKKIEFSWVRGHSGHPQNERCDELANLALDRAGF